MQSSLFSYGYNGIRPEINQMRREGVHENFTIFPVLFNLREINE